MTLPASVRSLLSIGLTLKSFFQVGAGRRDEADDSSTLELLQRAQEARRLGRSDEAATHYRLIVQRRRDHLGALRTRDLAAEGGRWREALDAQQRVLGAVGSTERSPETEWLAAIYYEPRPSGGRAGQRGRRPGISRAPRVPIGSSCRRRSRSGTPTS